jgi:RNA polymerase sigma factor (sigma-70 family)
VNLLSTSHRSDPTLVQACLRGDQNAWNTLVDRYGRLVYSIARRYGLDDADAEDVFQGVFLILFRRLSSLKDQTRLSSWLITTSHRECWRIGRRSGRAPKLDEMIEDVGAPDPDDAQRWEEQHIVHLGIERLGGSCADLLRALFLEPGDRSYEQIAASLGIKVGSIGPTRARCFAKLERILRDLGLEVPAASSVEAD